VQLVAFVLDICNDCFRRLWQLFQSSVAIVSDIYGLRFVYLWIYNDRFNKKLQCLCFYTITH